MGGRQLQLQRSEIDLFVCCHSNDLTIMLFFFSSAAGVQLHIIVLSFLLFGHFVVSQTVIKT